MTFLENRNDGSDDRLLPEFPQDVATSLKALSDATNFDFGEPADAGISSIEAPEAPAAIRNVKAPAAIRAIPERKSAELIRTNRVLLGMSFAALVLLGPSFIIGYVFGYGAARSSLPHSASMPAPASSPQNVLPATAVPHQSARAEPPKPAEPVRAKEPNPAQPADRLAAGQIYLQVAAAARNRSAPIIDALRDKGFPAVASEVPNEPSLQRVLIGPLREADLDKMRADLQRKGFPGNSAIKRTF